MFMLTVAWIYRTVNILLTKTKANEKSNTRGQGSSTPKRE